jgi:uroporphyrinogen III methyltransferase/synthase
LFGKSILVTVPSEETGRLCSMLEERGAGCVDFPLIEIQPLADYRFLDSAIRCMGAFDWVIFTSQNGVRFFFERLAKASKDARWINRARVAAIGPKTAEALKAGGIVVDTTPDEFRQEGLLARFKKMRVKGKKFLIVRAEEARDVLPAGLRGLGATVSVVPAYRTKLRAAGGAKASAGILKGCDLVTFTSSSCVEGFVKVFGKRYPRSISFASIGPVTSATCRTHGIRVSIEAKEYTLDGLAAAISSYYGKR